MKKTSYFKNSFSLVEISLVIAITGIMMSASVAFNKTQKATQKDAENKLRVDRVKKAIDSYFATYQRLPCPADPTLAITNANFGKERMDNTGTTCMATNMSNERSAHNQIVSFHDNGMSGAFMTAFIFGGVPVKNIGLDDKDAFDAYGNRITYVASDVLASYNRPSTGFIGSVLQGIKGFGKTKIRINNLNTGNRTELFSQFSSCGLDVYFGLFGASGTAHTGVNWQNSLVFTACNAGVYSVLNGQSVDGAINQLAYVVINHGANGFGAWNAAGQLNALSSDAFEKANSFAFYINPANNTATSNYSLTDSTKPLKFYYGQRTATFDDIVAWSTTKDLLINAGMSNGVYCHPTTHPKLTNATNADTGNNTTIIAKKYGENMADGSTSMICQGMGNWM